MTNATAQFGSIRTVRLINPSTEFNSNLVHTRAHIMRHFTLLSPLAIFAWGGAKTTIIPTPMWRHQKTGLRRTSDVARFGYVACENQPALFIRAGFRRQNVYVLSSLSSPGVVFERSPQHILHYSKPHHHARHPKTTVSPNDANIFGIIAARIEMRSAVARLRQGGVRGATAQINLTKVILGAKKSVCAQWTHTTPNRWRG